MFMLKKCVLKCLLADRVEDKELFPVKSSTWDKSLNLGMIQSYIGFNEKT